MPTRGFRLFKVGLRPAMGHAPQPWVSSTDDMLNRLNLFAGDLKGRRVDTDTTYADITAATGYPAYQSVKDRHLMMVTGTSLTGRRISLRFSYGTVGAFSRAIGETDEVDLGHRAAVRDYHVELLIPSAPDLDGLLVVEALSRACPYGAVCKGISLASRVADPSWWRLQTQQVTDMQFLRELLDRASDGSVRLRQTLTDGAGQRQRQQYTLQGPILASSWRDKLVAKFTAKAGPNDLLELMGVKDAGDLDFTDASITLDDQTIHWGKTEELFTYPVGAQPWNTAVSEVVARLRPDLDWG